MGSEEKACNIVYYYLNSENMKVLLCLAIVISTITSFPQSKTGCGVNERGVVRRPGDIWNERCNQCRCLRSGVPGCTRKFCESNPGQNKSCKDSEGNERSEGALWQEVKNRNVCACRAGVVLCGSLQPVTTERNLRTQTSDVNGNTKREGDTWKEDCNTCG